MFPTNILIACFMCLIGLFNILFWIFFEIISAQIQIELSKIGLSPIQFNFLTTSNLTHKLKINILKIQFILVKLIGFSIIILSFINICVIFGRKKNEIEAFTKFIIIISSLFIVFLIFYWNFYHFDCNLVDNQVSKYRKFCHQLIPIYINPCLVNPSAYLKKISMWTKYFSVN